MKMRHPVIWAVVVILGTFPALLFAATWEQEPLEINGDWQKRLDVVILGDGYTADQQDDFRADAERLVDYVFGLTPFRQYRSHYNFHLVYVISNQSGADIPSQGAWADTALDATFEAYGVDRLLVVNEVKATAAAAQIVGVDFIFVIVNHPNYGGSGGAVAVTSIHTDAPEILAHELGHMFAGLADEYEDAYPGFPPGDGEPNVTYATDYNRIPWSVWISPQTPLPTPPQPEYDSVVGLFEGARYLSQGIYRPRLNCRMRFLNVPFCEVCSEQLIRASYTFASPSDAAGATINLGPGGREEIDAQPVQTANYKLRLSWFVNGEEVAYNVARVPLIAECLGDGEHAVLATFSDQSNLIRLPDVRLLAGDEVLWTVRVVETGEADPTQCQWPPPDEEWEDGDEPDGDQPDGDIPDGDRIDGDTTEQEEDEEIQTDGDAADGDAPPWWLDGDVDTDEESPVVANESGGCRTSTGANLWLLLGLALLGLVRKTARGRRTGDHSAD